MGEKTMQKKEKALARTNASCPMVLDESKVSIVRQQEYCSVYDKESAGKFIEEIIAAAKDDRMNTKRVISADIASTARVHDQNDRYLAACERELRRKDLSEAWRKELFDRMEMAVSSSEKASVESRRFQQEHLNHSHKLPWKLIGIGALCFFGGLGSAALLRMA